MIVFNTLEILLLGVSKINYFRFSTKKQQKSTAFKAHRDAK